MDIWRESLEIIVLNLEDVDSAADKILKQKKADKEECSSEQAFQIALKQVIVTSLPSGARVNNVQIYSNRLILFWSK